MISDIPAWLAGQLDTLAARFNAVAVVGAAAAATVFGVRWWQVRHYNTRPSSAVRWFAALITLGMTLLALRQGYWQGYYVAIAMDAPDTAAWFLRYQGAAAMLTGLAGIVAALHLRHALERVSGRWWLAWVCGIVATAFIAGVPPTIMG